MGLSSRVFCFIIFSFFSLCFFFSFSSCHKWSLRSSGGGPILPPRLAQQHPSSLSSFDGLDGHDVPPFLLPPEYPPEQNISSWFGDDVLKLFRNKILTGIAVSIIPDFDHATPFVLRTFHQRLPQNYHMLILTSQKDIEQKQQLLSLLLSDRDSFTTSPPSSSSPSLFSSSQLSLISPSLLHNFNLWKYSCVMLSYWFYSTMPKGCTSILVLQADSLLLRKDNGKSDKHPSRLFYIRDFEKFSFVGAPWPQFDGHNSCLMGGNGGFSLRKREAMEEILKQQTSYPKTRKGEFCATEDLALNFLLAKNEKWKKRLPTVRQALHFSMEEVIKDHMKPIGIHKSWKFRKNNTDPDVQMMASLFSLSPLPHLTQWASSFLSKSPSPSSSVDPFSKFMEICTKICVQNSIISRKGVAKNQIAITKKCPIMPLTN